MQLKNYNIEMVSALPFYSMPKILIHDDFFKDLSSDAKVLYMIMQNRVALSQENKWVDDKGDIFIYMTLEEASNTLNCSIPTVRKAMKQLKEIGLIESIRQGTNKPNKIYVKVIINSDCKNFSIRSEKNFQSGVKKTFSQDCKNFSPRKNEYSNTENRKNDSSSCSSREEEETTTTTANLLTKEYIKKYIQTINPVASSYEINMLSTYEDDVSEDLILLAIDEAILNNVRKLNYIKAILDSCINEGITTAEQYNNTKKLRGNNNAKRNFRQNDENDRGAKGKSTKTRNLGYFV